MVQDSRPSGVEHTSAIRMAVCWALSFGAYFGLAFSWRANLKTALHVLTPYMCHCCCIDTVTLSHIAV